MSAKPKSCSFEDKNGFNTAIRKYLESQGFDLVGSENYSKACYASDRGTVVVHNHMTDFRTSVAVRAIDPALLEELTAKFPPFLNFR